MTFAKLLAVLILAGTLFFLAYYFYILRPRKGTLDWVALQEQPPLSFARQRHPMERRDVLPVLLLTALYAFSAFFSLGSVSAPQQTYDFVDGKSYTIQIEGEAVYVATIRSYGQLGTGGYNLEISKDGQHWSTLWTRTEKDQWDRDKTVYYWAQAEDFDPSYALPQSYNHVFKWTDTAVDNPQYAQYIRISGRGDRDVLQLSKLLIIDHTGQIVPFQWTLVDGTPQDEQAFAHIFALDDTVPEKISWRNSAYFDEIYHPRTALEHIQNANPYEITHPPLGKLIIGLGIRLFGMTAFGWRFMGALFGVLMVPLFYVFIKNIFGKTNLAVCGTVLFVTEFMHLTQTRIATIDTYGVFFILLSYFFFYRWLTASATPGKNGKVSEGYGQLALSGLFWGIGCACKWTVIYAGVGLAAIYLIHMILRIKRWPRAKGREEATPHKKLRPWLLATLGVSVVSFVVVPAVIYTLSYIPYAQAQEVALFAHSDQNGLALLIQNLFGRLTQGDSFAAHSIPKDNLVNIMANNQWYMLTYHQGVHNPHPYSSRWYQWLVDARPILYYSKDIGGGMTEKFAAFTNPLTTWLGLGAILTCVARCVRRMWAKLCLLWGVGLGCAGVCWLVGRVESGDFDPALDPQQLTGRLVLMGVCLAIYLVAVTFIALMTAERHAGLDIFLAVGFAAQFLPWVAIGRITFAYHYFPSLIFLILAICSLFHDLMECPRAKWRVPVYGVTAVSAGLYVLFYPVLTGLSVSTSYCANLVKFFPSWPF